MAIPLQPVRGGAFSLGQELTEEQKEKIRKAHAVNPTIGWMEDRPLGGRMPCTNCRGKKVDPKKRTRKCPTCGGSGMSDRCDKCNRPVRSSSLAPDIEYCDCYMIPPGSRPELLGAIRS